MNRFIDFLIIFLFFILNLIFNNYLYFNILNFILFYFKIILILVNNQYFFYNFFFFIKFLWFIDNIQILILLMLTLYSIYN